MLLIPLKAGDTSSPIRICNHIQHNIQVNKIAMILWFQVSFLSISLCMYNDFVIVPWQVLIYTFSDLYMSICEFSFSNMISYRIFSLKITKLYSFIHLFFSNKVVSEDVSKWLFWKVNREKYIKKLLNNILFSNLLFTTMTPAHSTFCSVKPRVQYNYTWDESRAERRGWWNTKCLHVRLFFTRHPLKKWKGLNYCS